MKISLKLFLQTGVLGDVQIGASLPEIGSLPGSLMMRESVSRDGQSKTYIYGDIHIGFKQDREQILHCSSVLWLPSQDGLHVPSDWIVEDWDLTASVKPDELKKYLRKQDIKYNFHNSKQYYVRQFPNSRTSADMAEAARTLGFLSFKKPKNADDILRTSTSMTFSFSSGVDAFFIDDKLAHVIVSDVLILPNDG